MAVAEELHFTRAAQRVHLSQQALSLQIRQFEASVGVPLLRRTTRKVELTAAGRTMLAHAVTLLAAADRAWEDAARVHAGEAGQVLLAYSPTARRELLPTILEEFGARHPDITVRSCEVWWGDSALADGLIEVSITRSRPLIPDDDIISVPLIHTPLGLVLGASHHMAKGERARLSDLRGEALKIPPRAFSPHFYDTIVSSLRLAGFGGQIEELAIFGSTILGSDPGARADIEAGRAFGIGFRNQYTSLEPELVWREVDPPILIPMHLCWRRDASPTTRNFVSVVLDVAQEHGWMPEAGRTEAQRLLAAV